MAWIISKCGSRINTNNITWYQKAVMKDRETEIHFNGGVYKYVDDTANELDDKIAEVTIGEMRLLSE